jgi:TolB-like protein/DNA-binding SARP family transcriptional activator/Tfp pilus assembly protein PilF
MSLRLRLLGGASIESPSGPLTGRAVQRRRLALLALLAAEHPRGVSRDRVIAYLWPESASEKGRALLSDSVYRVNQAIGGEAVTSAGDELRLDSGLLAIDLVEFREGVQEGELERAVGAYAGPFLDGFHVPDAIEFERWVDRQREELALAFGAALERLAETGEVEGDWPGAGEWWRRRAAHEPFSSRVTLRLMLALEAAGDRVGALRHAQVHTALVREEFGTEPDPEIPALAERLRSAPASGRPGDPSAPGGGLGTPPAAREGGATPTPPPSGRLPVPGPSRADPAGVEEAARSAPSFRTWRSRPVVLIAVVAGMVWIASRGGAGPVAPDPLPAIAVLPFVDLSPGRDQEYLGDGITEELINSLSRVEGLRVAARTSAFAFKGRAVDVRGIGEALGVETVLEGSVRRADDRLRITAQLVSARDGYQLWSEVYERDAEDILTIQEEIARAIVGNLRGRLVRHEVAVLAQRVTDDPEAYNLYLKGRYSWHRRTEEELHQAVGHFQQAVERAPEYALAWVGLADAWAVLGFYDYLPPREAFPRAAEAAHRALQIDGTLAEAHATLGYAALYHEWDWPAAEAAFRRSIELSPRYSKAHQWYANLLTAMGRFDEAVSEMRLAQELDPLSLIANAALGWVFYHAREYGESLEQCRRTQELDPGFALAYLWSGLALGELGREEEALQDLGRALELSGGSAISLAALARAHALAGRPDEAMELLTRLEDPGAWAYVPSYEVARVRLALGRREEALQWLEQAYRERAHSMVFLRVDPHFQALKGDPRFEELARRVGLVD